MMCREKCTLYQYPLEYAKHMRKRHLPALFAIIKKEKKNKNKNNNWE